jgi:hypothetical protein
VPTRWVRQYSICAVAIHPIRIQLAAAGFPLGFVASVPELKAIECDLTNIARNSMPNNRKVTPKGKFSIIARASKAWIPELIAAAGPEGTETHIDFFTATTRNRNKPQHVRDSRNKSRCWKNWDEITLLFGNRQVIHEEIYFFCVSPRLRGNPLGRCC